MSQVATGNRLNHVPRCEPAFLTGFRSEAVTMCVNADFCAMWCWVVDSMFTMASREAATYT
jgi:hypothetical protein